MILFTLLILLALLVVYTLWINYQDSRTLPPGPFRLPLIGNMLNLMDGDKMLHTLDAYSKVYGPMFRVFIGGKLCIVIADVGIAKEAYVVRHRLYSGKHSMFNGDIIFHNEGKPTSEMRGLFLGDGENWVARKAVLHQLVYSKRMVLGMQDVVHNQVAHLLTALDNASQTGQEFEIKKLCLNVNGSVISNVCFGFGLFDEGSEIAQEITSIMESIVRHVITPVIWDFIPSLRFLSYLLPATKIQQDVAKRDRLLLDIISKKKSTMDYDNPKDIAECLIALGKDDMEVTLLLTEVFAGGADTGATSLAVMLPILAEHPRVQEKVREELRRVVGDRRLLTADDMTTLPYLTAVITELTRIWPVAPVWLHRLVADDNLNGFTLPKDSMIFCNVLSISLDAKKFNNPKEFRPERWLEENADDLAKFTAFGIGPRQCPGMHLAKLEFYIFLGAILRDYEILPPKQPWDHDGVLRGVFTTSQVTKVRVNKLK